MQNSKRTTFLGQLKSSKYMSKGNYFVNQFKQFKKD